MKTVLLRVALLVSLVTGTGAALAQSPVITSFSGSGELICSNLMDGTAATVEWAASVEGPWKTNWADLEAVPVVSNGTINVKVPMFYRVRGIAQATMPAAPMALTGGATSVTGTAATINGSGNPNLAAATAWFRYSITSPGTGNDVAGTRAPASGGWALGAGVTLAAFSEGLSGLTPGTTYYYWAVVSNAVGVAVGTVQSFTTPLPPTVGTTSATSVASTTAILNGSANPNATATTSWFRYSTTNPGTGSDSFGTRLPTSGGTDVGSGTVSVPYSIQATGLTPATTYYFWAVASSPGGMSFGSVLSFTTPTAPAVVTSSATTVASTSATLNGSANPNYGSTTGWFRYSTAHPGSGNDTSGSRAPTSGGPALGSGSTPVSYSQGLTGLTPGTTYYYWAIASNSQGTSFGTVLSFTTPAAAPTVTTSAASPFTGTTATLNGIGNPNAAAAIGWFRYASASPGSGNDSFGTRVPASGGTALGSGTSAVAYSRAITGLSPGTTYYYCAIVSNAVGISFGAVTTFITASAPTTTTTSASSITSTSAFLNGGATPNRAATTAWFRYSTTNPGTGNDSGGTRVPATGGTDVGSGSASVPYTIQATGLTPATTYYFWTIASNSEGTAFGSVLSFTTPAPPVATTSSATTVASTSATLNGSGNPNYASTTGWFRYSTVHPGSGNDTSGSRAPTSGGSALGSGSTPVSYSQGLTGLTPGTTYYYWAIASNVQGMSFGSVMSFTTPAAAPAVSTSAASPFTGTTATLNGTGNPNAAAATGWFRYATASPGSGNDSFGTRAPASGGTALGSGTSAVAYSQAITGLSPGTTYYYCAIVSNAVGISFGAVTTFVTASAPSATTTSASSITSTSAILNGGAIPNRAATTAWFRYSTTNPGAGNDSDGTRVPATGGTDVGSGSASVPYSIQATGLTPATTYYFWTIASNSEGTAFGSVLSFTTPAAPTVTTSSATTVAGTSATLNGSGNPNYASTTGWFRYSTVHPGSGNDTSGTRAPTTGGLWLGAGSTPVSYSQGLTGLTPGTTYYYWAIASNAQGTSFGTVMSLTTPATAPAVTTSSATSITTTTAILNGLAIPNAATTTAWFRYSTTSPGTGNDTAGTRLPATGGTDVGSGLTSVPYSISATGLNPGTTYYFWAIANNSQGTSFGSVLTLITSN